MSTTSSDATILPTISLRDINYNNTTGTLFVEAIVSAFLSGTMSLQLYIYRKNSRGDHKFFRAVIYFLWILDLVCTALYAYDAHYYASKLDNALLLARPIGSFAILMPLGSLNDFIITFIYIWRVFHLCGRNWFAVCFSVVSVTLNMVGAGASIGIMVMALKVLLFSELKNRGQWLWYLAFGSRTALDLIVALTTIMVLSKCKTRFSRTNKIIRFIILYCINTGVLTISVAVLSMIIFAVAPDSFIIFAPAFLLPKCMLSAMLSFLNSRQTVKDIYFNGDALSIPPTAPRQPALAVAPGQERADEVSSSETLNLDPGTVECNDQTGKGIQMV